MTEIERHKEIMDTLKDISLRQDTHEKLDNERFKNVMNPDQLEVLMEGTMRKVFFGLGQGTLFWIKTIAIVIGALTVIGGGTKWFIGWIGYTRL